MGLSLGRLGVAVCAGVIVAGCAVGPDYNKPEIATSDRFNATQAANARQAAQSAPDLVTWWTGFDDPMLTRVIERVQKQNLDIAAAVARIEQARAGLQSANAGLLPQGSAKANAARVRLPGRQAFDQNIQGPLSPVGGLVPGYDRSQNIYSAGINASWQIDLFGGLRRDREAAIARFKAASAAAQATRLSMTANAADSYMAIRTLQARLAVTQRQVVIQRKLVDLSRLRVSRGIAPRRDLDQAEGALAQVAASVPDLQDNLAAALNGLDVLMGAPPGTYRAALAQPEGIDSAIPRPPAIDSAGGSAGLLRRRPDIIAAEQRLVATNAQIGAALANYYPSLSLSALVSSAAASTGDLFSSGTGSVLGLAGIRWRLFDFGRVDAQVKSARGQDKEALADYRRTVLQATEDVENALTSVVQQERRADRLMQGEASLVKARDAAELAYRQGQINLVTVLDADDRILQARTSRLQAQMMAAQAAVNAFTALGGGWDAPTQSVSRAPGDTEAPTS